MSLNLPVNTVHVRRANRARVLAEIRRHPGISRRQLSELTRLTEASLSRIARELIDSGIVKETEIETRSGIRGRPHVGLYLDSGFCYVLALSLSAYERKLSLVSVAGERLWQSDIPVFEDSPGARIVDYVSSQFHEARKAPDVRSKEPLGIACALSNPPGNFSEFAARARSSLVLDGSKLRSQIANLTSALHLAEAHRVFGGLPSNSLLIHAGMDLGASLINNGVLLDQQEGFDSTGFIVARLLDGGKKEILADVSSGRAILEKIGTGVIGAKPVPEIALRSGLPHAIRRANSGDPTAVAAFRTGGRQLALSFVATAALLNLQRIFLAGPLASARPYVQGFREVFDASFSIDGIDRPEISASTVTYLHAAEFIALNSFIFDDGKAFVPSSALGSA